MLFAASQLVSNTRTYMVADWCLHAADRLGSGNFELQRERGQHGMIVGAVDTGLWVPVTGPSTEPQSIEVPEHENLTW